MNISLRIRNHQTLADASTHSYNAEDLRGAFIRCTMQPDLSGNIVRIVALSIRRGIFMALPWLQIVQLVPSILDVSRELLRKTKANAPPGGPIVPQSDTELALRLTALEENERRQAELVSQMAEQLAAVARAITALHRQMTWLAVGFGVALITALVALGIALR